MRKTTIRWAALVAISMAASGCGKPATLADTGLLGPGAGDPTIAENDVYITFTGRAPRVAVITVMIGDNNIATVQIGKGNNAVSQSGGTGNIVQVGVVNAANSVNGSTGVVASNTQLVIPLSGGEDRTARSSKSKERSRRGDESRRI